MTHVISLWPQKKLGTTMPCMTHVISFFKWKSLHKWAKKDRYRDAVNHTCDYTSLVKCLQAFAQKRSNTILKGQAVLAMIKSSISSYQDQLATFVGIVCQDKKARPQKHSEGYEPKTTFFLTSIRNGTNSQIFITAST